MYIKQTNKQDYVRISYTRIYLEIHYTAHTHCPPKRIFGQLYMCMEYISIDKDNKIINKVILKNDSR